MVQYILFGIFVLAALVVLLVYVNIKSGYDVEDFKEENNDPLSRHYYED